MVATPSKASGPFLGFYIGAAWSWEFGLLTSKPSLGMLNGLDLFQNGKTSWKESLGHEVRVFHSTTLVEQTLLFVVFFLNLDYLLPVNNRQKFRHELYPHLPCNRSLLLQYIDFQHT
jgi:hypothetical protein